MPYKSGILTQMRGRFCENYARFCEIRARFAESKKDSSLRGSLSEATTKQSKFRFCVKRRIYHEIAESMIFFVDCHDLLRKSRNDEK
ncbi:hypothetical protein ACWIUD_06910 [Helicobacter sp. 23-1044]